MKNQLGLRRWVRGIAIFTVVLSGFSMRVFGAEPWKGESPKTEFEVGGLAGLGVVDNRGGFTVMGLAAKKILNRGFVPDINNQVFVELQLGPLFISGGHAYVYSAHLRWDFHLDPTWTFYALGGLGGMVTSAALGNQWRLYPRTAVGAVLHLASPLGLRAEVSHEQIVLGAVFEF